MKKSKRLVWILAFACILIGVCFTGFGFSIGGKLHSGWGVNFGRSFGFSIFDDDNDSFVSDGERKKLDAFTSVNIDVAMGDIVVEDGNDFSITIQNMDERDYTLTQKDGTLHFVYDKDEWNLFNFDSSDYKIIVTIPENEMMKEIKIDSAMGDVEIRNVDCKNLDVDQNMGAVDVKNVIVEGDTLIEQDMGDIDFTGSPRGKSEFNNSMGDIDIKIQDKKDDYRYRLNTSLGDLDVDDKKKSEGVSANIEGGDEKAKYEIIADNSMGDISLEFER